nr:glycosyltransferase [Lachnospiraceae bacterium]
NMPVGGCDCYLIDRKVIEVLKLLGEKNSSLTLQVLWSGFKTDRIYFHRDERKSGKSRWTMSKKVKLAMDSMMSFSYFPIRFMTTLGFIFALLAVLWIIEIIIEKLVIGTPIAGWASIMCLNLFTSGAVMLMVGVIGEYVWRTLDASRSRPPFIIDRIESESEEKEKERK